MSRQELEMKDKKPFKNDDQRMIIVKKIKKLNKASARDQDKMKSIKENLRMYKGRDESIKEYIEKKGLPVEAIIGIKLDKIKRKIVDKMCHGCTPETEEFCMKLDDLVDKVKGFFAYGNKEFLEMTDESEGSIEEVDKKQSEEI